MDFLAHHFPVSGVETWVFLPPVVAFVVSFFTSMGGVSGAFLLLPFQVSYLGYTGPGVTPTNLIFNIVAIPSGVWRYLREGRMLWPLAGIVVAMFLLDWRLALVANTVLPALFVVSIVFRSRVRR